MRAKPLWTTELIYRRCKSASREPYLAIMCTRTFRPTSQLPVIVHLYKTIEDSITQKPPHVVPMHNRCLAVQITLTGLERFRMY